MVAEALLRDAAVPIAWQHQDIPGINQSILTQTRTPPGTGERGGRIYEADRTEQIWSEADIAKAMSVASKELHLALVMALWTGQRQGDLLALQWDAYDGTTIRLTQSKSKGRRAVSIKVGFPLKALLDQTPRRSTFILTNQRGALWTSDGFRTSWGKMVARAGIENLNFHGLLLRGSTVTRLALEGSPPQEIASVTGHSLQDVCDILDAHYLGERTKLAEMASRGRVVARLEREGWIPRHGGDYDVYKHPSKPGRIVVARHRTVSIGVARVIAKTAGWVD